MPCVYPPPRATKGQAVSPPKSGDEERMQAQAKLVANQHNHRLAEKQRIALANRIKYLNAQNSRVLRDLQAVHRTAQKLDQGRVRQMERHLHEREVKDEKDQSVREKAMKVAGIRQERKEISWKIKGVRETRLNEIKHQKEDRCKSLMKSTDVVENNIANLEEEEKMCVERLTYSKMMSQRVLYQLERNIGSRQSESLKALETGREIRDQKPDSMPVSKSPRPQFQPSSRTATPQYVASTPVYASGPMPYPQGVPRGLAQSMAMPGRPM